MPFTIGSRTIYFIDGRNATPDDYIEVRFDSGYKAILVGTLNGTYGLRIDRKRTDATVLEELYGAFGLVIERQSFGVRRRLAQIKRKENLRETLVMSVQSSPSSESANEFPEVGGRLRVTVGHSDLLGADVYVGSPIKSVKFS